MAGNKKSTLDRKRPAEVVDPNSPLGKAISAEFAEFLAEVDQRIARDEAADQIRSTA